MAANGLSCDQTAAALHLAFNTVKHHRQSVMYRLGANNMAHAVAIAFRTGVLRRDEIVRGKRLAAHKILSTFDRKPVGQMTVEEAMQEWERLRAECAVIGAEVRKRRPTDKLNSGPLLPHSYLTNLWTEEQQLSRRNRQRMSLKMKAELDLEFEEELAAITEEDEALAREFEERSP